MKTYGRLRDRDEGDVVANCMNATKTSNVGGKHGCLRSTKQKRRFRTSMNKVTRTELKNKLNNDLKNL